jgi:hypothetical protein
MDRKDIHDQLDEGRTFVLMLIQYRRNTPYQTSMGLRLTKENMVDQPRDVIRHGTVLVPNIGVGKQMGQIGKFRRREKPPSMGIQLVVRTYKRLGVGIHLLFPRMAKPFVSPFPPDRTHVSSSFFPLSVFQSTVFLPFRFTQHQHLVRKNSLRSQKGVEIEHLVDKQL